MSYPPFPPRVRVTVPVTEDTLEAFQHLASAQGTSVGRAMADWLADQLPAVTYLALQMEQVREGPQKIAEQLVPPDARRGAPGTGAPVLRSVAAAAEPDTPRPVIRGGKSPGKTRRTPK